MQASAHAVGNNDWEVSTPPVAPSWKNDSESFDQMLGAVFQAIHPEFRDGAIADRDEIAAVTFVMGRYNMTWNAAAEYLGLG